MDAYSISYTSTANRNSSRIYQDLHATRLNSLVDLDQENLLKRLAKMEAVNQRSIGDLGTKPHVAVVGAGISGLRCADILLQRGFQVTVIEARNRVGGRLHQEMLPNGHLVDLGPNWIHGTKENPMLDLAKETGTIVGSWDTRSYIFDEFGKLFDVDEGEEHATVMWDIVQEAFKHSNKSCKDIDAGESLHDFFLQQVVERVPSTEEGFEKKRKTIMQMAESWGAFVGSPVFRQSLKFFWLEECIEGENLLCAGTYKKVLDTIAQPALEGAEIKLQTKVERISYRRGPEERPSVQVEGGQVLEFDEVVITTPLGWLKRNLDAFEPALPARMTKAIGAIGYGCLEKVYVSFPNAFWRSPEGTEQVVEGFIQWLSPSYASESNPNKWNQEVVELSSLDPSVSHPTLLFYTYGEQSVYITAQLAELPTQEKKDEFLLDFFKPYFSRLPYYSENNPDCKPTNFLATNWVRDELSGYGSYSNFQVGLENGDDDILVMREGLPNQGLWLAGEHTAPFVGLGTATGAYWSGESVGRRIAESYGRAKKTLENL